MNICIYIVKTDYIMIFCYRLLDLGKLRHVDLSGVISANENNKEAQPKGIKAFFNMDDNGILNIDKVCLFRHPILLLTDNSLHLIKIPFKWLFEYKL